MSLNNIYIFKCGYFVLTDIPYTFKNLQKINRKECVTLLSALSRERILSTIRKTWGIYSCNTSGCFGLPKFDESKSLSALNSLHLILFQCSFWVEIWLLISIFLQQENVLPNRFKHSSPISVIFLTIINKLAFYHMDQPRMGLASVISSPESIHV